MRKQNIVVVGLGETGFSCAEYFSKKNIPIVVVDTREQPPRLSEFTKQFPEVPVFTGGFPKEVFQNVKTVVLSPGVSKKDPDLVAALSESCEIVGDIELFAREVKAPIIAITGSNGKSTVTTLVGEMAKAANISVGVGGNLGIPVLSLLSKDVQLYVLELSSFQLETTYSLKPAVATILNVVSDHLDRYASLQDYQIAKERIFLNAQKIVINRDNLQSVNFPKNLPLISFGLSKPEDNHYGLIEEEETWLARGEEKLLSYRDLKIIGSHNLANALAALALGESVGLPIESMLKAIQDFRGLAHRCEWVSEIDGIQWVNDSKGTNVGATISALEGLENCISGQWVLIAGGIAKNADFEPLKKTIVQHCRGVVLIGKASEELFELLSEQVACVQADSMLDAVQKALSYARNGDGVLLSPACASFDMFDNFEARGEAFKDAVKTIDK